MKILFQISLVVAIASTLVSCNKEYEDITTDSGFKGAFIQNEAGSISYYSVRDTSVTVDIYNTVNGVDLGGPFTAFSISGNKGYVLKGAINDQKIETLDSKTLKSEGEQSGFSNLTDLVAVSDTFVVVAQDVPGSENSGFVNILDSKDLSKTIATFNVGKKPTKLAYSRGKKVYVASTGGGELPDFMVMVIDIDSKEVTDTLALEQQIDELNTLKLSTPIDMILDGYQNLWVLCAGESDQEAGLARITYGTHEVTVFPFENGYKGNGKNGLATSSGGGTIYFMNDGLYAIGFNDTALPEKKFFTEADYTNIVYDAIGVNPFSGRFFCAKDGADGANGMINIFDKYGFILKDENGNISEKATQPVGKKPRQLFFVR